VCWVNQRVRGYLNGYYYIGHNGDVLPELLSKLKIDIPIMPKSQLKQLSTLPESTIHFMRSDCSYILESNEDDFQHVQCIKFKLELTQLQLKNGT
jgi:hypothetical protein